MSYFLLLYVLVNNIVIWNFIDQVTKLMNTKKNKRVLHEFAEVYYRPIQFWNTNMNWIPRGHARFFYRESDELICLSMANMTDKSVNKNIHGYKKFQFIIFRSDGYRFVSVVFAVQS